LLTVVGLSYRRAPVELRELVSVTPDVIAASLQSFGNAVILTTCNRTEIYQDLPNPEADAPARAFLLQRSGPHRSEVDDCLYAYSGEAAVRHLFLVATGLDSMVLGESQILGQLREALDSALTVGSTTPALRRAFQDAVRLGRRARSETFIGRHAVSVSYAAVELAREVFGSLNDCRAVVVGAGETGELTARTLVEHGVAVIAVANRTIGHAERLVRGFHGRAVRFEDLPEVLVEADIVLSATDAPGYVVSHDAVRRAVASRPDRPLFLIDMAVPRDVDPACGEIPNVRLYGIDDLKARCEANRDLRGQEIQRVHALIADELGKFVAWERTRAVLPTVVALREHAEECRREELAEALSRLKHLDESDKQVVADLSRALVNKLLHEPTTRLKADAQDEFLVAAIGRIFGLAD